MKTVLHLRCRVVDVDEPDLVAVGSFDRRPAKQARSCRKRLRRGARRHVEAERLAPGSGSGSGDAAGPGEERVRVACDPRQHHGGCCDGSRQRAGRVDDAAFAKGRARRQLELVADRARHRIPGERGRAREGRGGRLVSAQQEAVQVRRCDAANRLRRLGRRRECEQAETDGEKKRSPHGPLW